MTKLVIPHFKNWARVRIWKPIWGEAEKLQIPGSIREPKPSSIIASLLKSHVGHASVQTAKFYASIFPNSQNQTLRVHTGKPVDLGFVESPQEDELIRFPMARTLKVPESWKSEG